MENEFLIPVSLFIVTAFIIKILADARTRNRLIEKGIVDDKVKNIFGVTSELAGLNSLKWGMVLVGIGLAAIISQMFPYDVTTEIAFGLMMIFAGVAFLVFYFIADKRLKEANRDKHQ